jgi:hypothetical protein
MNVNDLIAIDVPILRTTLRHAGKGKPATIVSPH